MPTPTLQDILGKMSAPSKADKALVEKAYNFVAEAHKDHKRFSGEPYLVHLVETAKGIAELGLSAKTVAAGLLHDSIEDVGVTPEQITAEFGKEICFLVEGVTKLGRYKNRGAARHREPRLEREGLAPRRLEAPLPGDDLLRARADLAAGHLRPRVKRSAR